MMPHQQHESEIVEVYEEELDGDMDEILNQSGDLQYGEEDDRTDGDIYGGMPLETYNNIVRYKQTQEYPHDLNNRQDRSASSHWRSRCQRFELADDNETLIYFNPSSNVNQGQQKVVVKKGEVQRVLERVHELIGHLGQKRTQMVVLKKLHWRSVRQDVKTYIMNCSFCNHKKLEGKKILKAPVDISSDTFGIHIEVRSKAPNDGSGFDRLTFSLVGYDEGEVQAAAMTRMTAYTFKETAPDVRGGRYTRVKTEYSGGSTFRRQPYIKRARYGQYATSSYMLPYAPKGNREETEFIMYPSPRHSLANNYNVDPDAIYETIDELVDARGLNGNEDLVADDGVPRVQTITANGGDHDVLERQIKNEPSSSHDMPLIFESSSVYPKRSIPSRPSATSVRRKRARLVQGPGGTAARFSMALADSDRDIAEHSADLLTPLDGAEMRPELLGLAPIMFMPSMDPEVVQLQKELIKRQLRIQDVQEKVLQSQYESMRIPIARYEEIDPRNSRMQMMDHDDEEEVIEEGVDMDQELNVMDSGDDEDYQR